MGIESRLVCAPLVFCLPAAGDRDEAHAPPARRGAQPPRDFVAVEVGQADVDERDVGVDWAWRAQGLRRRRGSVHSWPLTASVRQHEARVVVVLDEREHAARHKDGVAFVLQRVQPEAARRAA